MSDSAKTEVAPTILYDVADGIATVTFNRPEARNAFTFEMYERLVEICETVNADTSIRAVILTGAGGRAFAAGTDIAQFRAFSTPEDALGYEARIDRVLGALETCRAPTIAAIAGACTGGGAAIAGSCDLRIAASNSRFGFPIARTLGNCLSMSNYARFAELLGTARLKELIFTARLFEAPEALSIGLVSEVVAEPADVMPRAQELARLVAGHAPLTLQATKQALRRLRPAIPRDEGDRLILMCYMSDDFREGMNAFLEKRAPSFSGKHP
ncbi:enoyl-CoA hydratase [Bosea vestrisii]|uniref:enoyl-CoA hydratase n=1 Tax=Bosea vestrisii TaxID=151416 RepID=UPI0024E01719|nr:enoyl-CoA hydratase [Bosea vestrisii]WID98930.1 enoyl-CoA hydratase [Bosea vestrisii]